MRVARLIAVALFAVVGWLSWQVFFPGDERRIRARLNDIVSTVNNRSGAGLARVADAARLASFFSDDVLIELGAPYAPIRGRQALVAAASEATRTGGFALGFVDVDVLVGPTSDEATAHFTATLTWTNTATGERTMDAREVEVNLRKRDNAWLITGARPVETLERPR